MLKSSLNITLRNFIRNKTYSVINVLGLSIGLAFVIIILSWVKFELSFDRFHQYSDRIYLVQKSPFNTLAPSFVPLLKEDFPEIEEIARMTDFGEFVVKYNEKSFIANRLFFAEENIFNILISAIYGRDGRASIFSPIRQIF
jgi:putative ABC transport system permease protein